MTPHETPVDIVILAPPCLLRHSGVATVKEDELSAVHAADVLVDHDSQATMEDTLSARRSIQLR